MYEYSDIRKRRKYLYAYYLKGVSLTEFKNYEKAIQSFDKALEIKPRYAAAYVGKGRALYELESFYYTLETLFVCPRKGNLSYGLMVIMVMNNFS